jgi:hypothetical protein
MIRDLKPLAFVSVVLVSSLSLGACGDDDGQESSEGPSDSGGEPGTGGATGGRNASTGGKAATAPAGDCKPPADAVEHCYAENGDREGTATCSEYYQAGLAMLFCTAPEAGGCPESDELAGVCIGGLTSSYYYADSANEGFWVAAEPGCEVNGGSWCE